MTVHTAAPASCAVDSADALWTDYRAVPNDETRGRLVGHYLPLIHKVVRRIKTRLPGEVDSEDLAQEGVFGLMHAIDAFDVTQNVKFETFASVRIRGAVLDYLRSIDWQPRGARERTKAYEAARRSYQTRTGEVPDDHTLREELGATPEQYDRIRRAARMSRPVSLDAVIHQDEDGGAVVHTIADPNQRQPLEELERRELRQVITREFSASERLMFLLYYYERMTMKEIGMTMRISESRVSQILTKVRQDLRERYQAGRLNLLAA